MKKNLIVLCIFLISGCQSYQSKELEQVKVVFNNACKAKVDNLFTEDELNKIISDLNDTLIHLTDSIKLFTNWVGTIEYISFYDNSLYNNIPTQEISYSLAVQLANERKLILESKEVCNKDNLSNLFKKLQKLKIGDRVYFDGVFAREFARQILDPTVDVDVCNCMLPFWFSAIDEKSITYSNELSGLLHKGKQLYDTVAKYSYGNKGEIKKNILLPMMNSIYKDTIKLNSTEKEYILKCMDRVFFSPAPSGIILE